MRQRNDDIFQDTTMTFGEHLEELRICLFKAILGLLIGCGIGLIFGGYVTRFIQKPVVDALTLFYEEQAARKAQEKLAQLQNAGYDLSGDPTAIAQIMTINGLTFEEVLVNPKEILQQLHLGGGNSAKPSLPPPPVAPHPPSAEDLAQNFRKGLTPIFLWRKVADDQRVRLKTFSSQESFAIWLKASLLVGVVLASPWVFYQIWLFVAAGLYPRERRYVHVYLPFSVVLFLLGVGLAFFEVFPPVLKFLLGFNSWQQIEPMLRFDEWMGLLLMLPLGFGIAFQLPLVMLFLERIGVVTVRSYLSSWRVAILAIFIAAMILSPSGDPYSMLLMAIPLTGLYFGGVLLCRYMPRHGAEGLGIGD
jgi:sec-independent protein translocase protein TatC